MRILVVLQGSSAERILTLHLRSLGLINNNKFLVLGLLTAEAERETLAFQIESMKEELREEGSKVEAQFGSGSPEALIGALADEFAPELIVLAADEPGFWSRLTHATRERSLAGQIEVPLLVSRGETGELERILIATGGEATSIETIKTAAALIARSNAQVDLLHVMSQLALHRDAPADDLEASGQAAIDHQTREGIHLQSAIRILESQGVTGPIKPILRHGLVVDEVLMELQHGGYDLLVIGAHGQPQQSKLMEMLLENVSDLLLTEARSSVLIVWPSPSEVDREAN